MVGWEDSGDMAEEGVTGDKAQEWDRARCENQRSAWISSPGFLLSGDMMLILLKDVGVHSL